MTNGRGAERVRFQTETGSVYVVERLGSGEMLSHRELATLASGPLRSEAGVLVRWPTLVLGEPVLGDLEHNLKIRWRDNRH